MHVIPAQAGIHFSRQGALRYDIDATLGSLPPAAKALKKIRLPGAALGTVLWPKTSPPTAGKPRGRSTYISLDEVGHTAKSAYASSGTATPGCFPVNSHSWLFSRGTATPGCSPKRASQPPGDMSPDPRAEFTFDSRRSPDFCIRSHRHRPGRDQTQISRVIEDIMSDMQSFLRKNKAFSQDLLPRTAPL